MEISNFWNLFILVMVYICPFIMGNSLCPEVKLDIKGGSFTLSDMYNNNSILKYICPEGYYPDPVKKRVCNHGQWSPAPRKSECKKVTCPDPKVLQNGEVQPYKRMYFVNDTITIVCNSGNTFRGSETRTCQVNGKWSGNTPVCSSSYDHCHDPGIPPGASRAGSSFNIDDTVVYRCHDKLKLVGSQERICQDNGQWSGNEPECYAEFTYDSPEEVADAFGGSLKTSLSINDDSGQYGKLIRVDKGGNLDIYIALDASESIARAKFEEAKNVVLTLMDKISYYQESPNYEIIIFATNVTKIVTMEQFKREKETSPGEAIKKLRDFKFVAKRGNSGTNIAAAYKTIYSSISLEQARNGSNDETQHVVIMFTDGSYNMGGDPKIYVERIKETVYKGDPKREKYLDLYAFGVGASVEKEGMNKWVTKRDDNDKHFFLIPNMQKMQETLDYMIDESTKVGLCGLYKNYDEYHDDDDDDDNNKLRDESKRLTYPWLTKIIVHNIEGKQNCIGSLVTPKFILTAAHCFKYEENPRLIEIEAINTKGRIRLIPSKHISHPKYNPYLKKDQGIKEYYEYDVALIELEQYVQFSKQLRPICIPCTVETSAALKLPSQGVTCKQHEEMLMKKDFVNAFFTRIQDKKDVSKKTVQIKLKNKEAECIEITRKALNITEQVAEDLIHENFLCTGGAGHKTVDDQTCPGDSGGPTYVSQTYRLFQIGIVSWSTSDKCQDKNIQVRDFHINLFNPKIREFLKEHLGDERKEAPLHFL